MRPMLRLPGRPGQTGHFQYRTRLPSSPGDSGHDLVISDMIMIGLIGLSLDATMRLLEGVRWVRWRYAH